MIVVGEDNFAEGFAKKMKSNFIRVQTKTFPDGESYIRISNQEKIKNEKVIVVSRGKTPEFGQDRLIIKTILLLHKIKELGVKKIGLFIPYMPYARQDKEFLPGEVVSVKIIRKLLEENCDFIASVTNHDKREEGWVDKKFYNIDATPSVIKFLKSKNFKNSIVAAPDMTSKRNVERLAESLNTEVLAIKKERDLRTGKIKSYGEIPNLSGKTLIFYDDLVSTGGTILKAIDMAKKSNPEKIICVVVHALDVFNKNFNKSSISAIKEACNGFYASDTVENTAKAFSILDQAVEVFNKYF